MQSNSLQEILNAEHPVKKQWLKPDIEIISVESGIRQSTFEHTRIYHLTTPLGGSGTVNMPYFS